MLEVIHKKNSNLKIIFNITIIVVTLIGSLLFTNYINEEFYLKNKISYHDYLIIKDMDIESKNDIIKINNILNFKILTFKILTFKKFFKVENVEPLNITYNYLNNELICDKSGFHYEFKVKETEILIENVLLKDIIELIKNKRLENLSHLNLIEFLNSYLYVSLMYMIIVFFLLSTINIAIKEDLKVL